MVLASEKKTPDKATESKLKGSAAKKTTSSATKSLKAGSSVESVVQAQTDSYRGLSRTLAELINALEQDRAALIHSRKTHEEVVRRVVELSKGTPLSLSVFESHPSLNSVHELVAKTSKTFEDKFDSDIIDYVIEWKKIVDLKFESEIKEVDQSQRNLAHYQKKFAGLRSEKDKMEAQDKQISPKRTDKFQRNQEKLEEAEHRYEKHVSNLSQLSSDLVMASWRDLKPLLVKLLEFDASHAEEKAVVLAECRDVLTRLKETSERNAGDSPIAMKKLPSEAVRTNIPMTPGVEKAMDSLGEAPKKTEEKEETENMTEVEDLHEIREEPEAKAEV